MVCDLSDELGIRYLLVLDMVRRAERDLYQAVTLTNIECATTELRRLEGYRLDILRELVQHCGSHACATPEVEEICRHAQISGTMAGAA
jgi:hypothetical protein